VANDQTKGAVCGLGAAALFGVSAPVAKLLLQRAEALPLAALLYLGAFGLLSALGALPVRSFREGREPRLRLADAQWVLGIAVLGGMLGPVLMLVGLTRVSGTTGSLLLNLEGPFTIVLAVLVFREHLGRAGIIAVTLILAGALALGVEAGQLRGDVRGVLALAGACLSWGLDNNLVQRLSVRDPVALARAKTAIAGVGNVVLALVMHSRWPSTAVVLGALALGAMSYGLSILLDVYALRYVGAAREAAYFATAPFVGAIVAVPLLGERPGALQVGAAGLLVAGVFFLLRERHGHVHRHEALEHEHLHVHDEHHRHEHEGPVTEPHSHLHRHAPLTHDHAHVSDLHHRHPH
jgi:drug/metabolite transporter (DMT)-like permease